MLNYQEGMGKSILWNQHLGNQAQKAMDERRQFKGGHPDHGPKKGATNLEAGLGF
jgi:hypothetical protein